MREKYEGQREIFVPCAFMGLIITCFSFPYFTFPFLTLLFTFSFFLSFFPYSLTSVHLVSACLTVLHLSADLFRFVFSYLESAWARGSGLQS